MKLQNLIANLNNPDPAIRADVAHVLGMVTETRALKAIGDRYKTEADPGVKEALAWAGKQIYAAQQAGHNTQEAMFAYFGVTREVANAGGDDEEKLLNDMQRNLDVELMRMQQSAAAKKAGMAAAAGLAGAVIGGGAMGAMGTGMMNMAMQPGAELASSNLGQKRPAIGEKRTPATRPATTDITIWVKRLLQDPNPDNRAKATIELRTMNNPAALPHLASAVINDRVEAVRQAAQQAGQHLYWSTAYWHMEQDGSLQAEIDRRLVAMGQQPAAPPAAPTPQQEQPAQHPQEDISAILRSAKAGRRRRKGKK